jgi:hypothetical protein
MFFLPITINDLNLKKKQYLIIEIVSFIILECLKP